MNRSRASDTRNTNESISAREAKPPHKTPASGPLTRRERALFERLIRGMSRQSAPPLEERKKSINASQQTQLRSPRARLNDLATNSICKVDAKMATMKKLACM